MGVGSRDGVGGRTRGTPRPVGRRAQGQVDQVAVEGGGIVVVELDQRLDQILSGGLPGGIGVRFKFVAAGEEAGEFVC